MRKGRCIILIGSLFPLCIHGQILNTPYNLPRSGDRLMKCQIATIPPSKSGIQQIWNFANIKYQEANYELYLQPIVTQYLVCNKSEIWP